MAGNIYSNESFIFLWSYFSLYTWSDKRRYCKIRSDKGKWLDKNIQKFTGKWIGQVECEYKWWSVDKMQLFIRCEIVKVGWIESSDGCEYVDIEFSEIVILDVWFSQLLRVAMINLQFIVII